MKSGNSFLDRLIQRMDRLDPASLQTYVLRLVRERGFLETVFNTIREGVIVVDKGLRIRFINSAAQAMLGIGEEAGNQRIDRYLKDVDWGPLMEADAEQWRRVSRHEIEVFYPRHRYLSFYVVPVNSPEDNDDGMPCVTLIFHDVTEMHRDTEKHIESERVEAITMLAAGVAHELGNPLNSLNIHLQLLQRSIDRIADESLRDDAADLVRVATHEVERLDTIVSNFLQAVRPVPPKLAPLVVRQVIEEAVAFMRLEIENRDIQVEVIFPESLPRVFGDADQLKQAFYNLIKNAVQAMNDGGCLRIICGTRTDFLDIRFVDDGVGISAGKMPQIMQPYFTTKPGGTGLGLLIVERIVRGHGGDLGIESEEGKGAVFTISLPLRERQVRLLESGARSTPTGAGGSAAPG